jgi:hypothetical protein
VLFHPGTEWQAAPSIESNWRTDRISYSTATVRFSATRPALTREAPLRNERIGVRRCDTWMRTS